MPINNTFRSLVRSEEWTDFPETEADFPGMWLHFLVQRSQLYNGMKIHLGVRGSNAQDTQNNSPPVSVRVRVFYLGKSLVRVCTPKKLNIIEKILHACIWIFRSPPGVSRVQIYTWLFLLFLSCPQGGSSISQGESHTLKN